MKVGMIFECGPQGADLQVCGHLAARVVPGIEVSPATLDNKRKLIADCGPVAGQLLANGCRGVMIIWDLFPPWRGNTRPCRREDRQAIHRSLRRANVPSGRVALVCVHEELEAWLLADRRALEAVLSTAAHPVRIRHARNPDRLRNPKKHLGRLFLQHTRRQYVDRYHAIQIATSLPDLSQLRRVATFARFADRLEKWARR